ncbi:MAG: trypsin-like serine peptidase [Microthrixaceae bacterium]
MRGPTVRLLVVAALGASALLVSSAASAGKPTNAGRPDDVAAYWTPQRVAAAQPRDLVIDSRGLGYDRSPNGSLTPHGHSTPARLEQVVLDRQAPTKKPSGGGNDTTPPLVTHIAPSTGATITASTTDQVSFEAFASDSGGVQSVAIVIHFPNGSTQSFSAASLGNDRWGTAIIGFTESTDWGWHVVAKDNARRGGNTTTTEATSFTIQASDDPGGDPGTETVTNSPWNDGGDIQGAAGRILFEMPTVRGRRTTWNAYVCSGTAVEDSHLGASIILTAAHCVYDDIAKQFARNVLFIPNQAATTTGAVTDGDCSNDPIGCWSPTDGVVDKNWTTRKFPANVEWDYGYYIVPEGGAHEPGYADSSDSSDSLEEAVMPLTIAFSGGATGSETRALGYSYSDDPNFMYCAEVMQDETNGVNWWLPNCGLSGGASGGPWLQPVGEAGNDQIISVNSWGYTDRPGMAGPYLDESARCTFGAANANADADTENVDRGIIATCTAD